MEPKEWMKWLTVIFGLAVLVVPFVLTGNTLTWTLVVLGVLAVIVGAWALGVSKNGWYGIVLGVIILAVPFFLKGTTLQWIEAILGIVLAVVGYSLLTKK